ncbi:MAG: trigger factor [Gemmatimonadota bacterium]
MARSQIDDGLQVSIEEGAAWSRKMVITVPTERVRSARSQVARQLSKRVRIHGFRKGKVPVHILEARYAEDIDRQTQNKLIDDAFQEAVRDNDLDPISEPRLANLSYDSAAEFTFEVQFDVRPQISLGRLGGFRINRPAIELREADVDELLAKLREQAALWKPVERRPEAGDNIQIEITNLESDDHQPRPYNFVLGQGHAIPGVESAIMTLEPGSSDGFTVEFPDDFPDEDKRGQSQQLRIELKQVMEQELPELDDELAKSVSDHDSLEALREALAAGVQREKEHQGELELERQLIEQIMQSNPFDVPDTMINHYIGALLGPPPEGADAEVVRAAVEEARPTALWGIKRSLILQRIAEDQGFEASAEEVKERVDALAKRTGKPPTKVRARLAKSGGLKEIERRIVDEKVFSFLKQQSEIEDSQRDRALA